VPPKTKLPSENPVTAQALELSLPAVVGLGSKPAPAKAVEGFVPTVVGTEFEKSISTEGEAFVKLTCPQATFADKNKETLSKILQKFFIFIFCLSVTSVLVLPSMPAKLSKVTAQNQI
jgi:hypothetical protein